MRPIWRLFLILAIFGGSTVAWMVLGGITTMRSGAAKQKLHGQVSELWGTAERQTAPKFSFSWMVPTTERRTELVGGVNRVTDVQSWRSATKEVSPNGTTIDVALGLDQRLRGLVWHSLYNVVFDGRWQYEHRETIPGTLQITFDFPSGQGLYDDFHFLIDGVDQAKTLRPENGHVIASVEVRPGQKLTLGVTYRSRGTDEWSYTPAQGVTNLENFHLAMTTDFAAIDFPAFTMSPSTKQRTDKGWKLDWVFTQVVTGHSIGMAMPARIQPGELAAALSFSAPISLGFFFLVLFVLGTLRKIDFHPMHYLFLAGAFFSFHLLFGYLVDHVTIVPAFVVASAVSLFLVVSYLRLVVSNGFAFREAALAQLVYLVGFSLAHFWDGYTGLTVTVLSIATLFLLMQLTGRIRWSSGDTRV